MAVKVHLENIIKKASVFRCITHKKSAILKVESGVIIIQACCYNFHDHIESFVERQIELVENEESHEQV